MKIFLGLTLLMCGIAFSNNASAADGDGISYKGVNISLGGFLASETVYRPNNTASDIDTNFAKLPFANSYGYGNGEFRGSERQSRFSLLAQGKTEGGTQLAGYYELDFFGTSPSANSNESNSFTPRTRHVYMQADWEGGWHLLAGQTWSLVGLNSKGITPRAEVLPPTIDAQYAVGFDWARQWQLRATKDWDKTLWVAVSLENSQTTGVAGVLPAGTGNTYQLAPGAQESNNLSMNSWPDAIVKVAYEPGYGHYEIFNLARNFQSNYGGTAAAAQNQKQYAWGDAYGAGVSLPIVADMVDLNLSGMYGRGVGRYGTSQLPDATYGPDGSLVPLQEASYLAQVNIHPMADLDISVDYGTEVVTSNAGTNASGSAANGSGYGDNITGTNYTGCNTLGGACAPQIKDVIQENVIAWWSFYKGNYGTMKLGAQYSHTQVDSFNDATGNSVTTGEDMIYTSLRYYPF